MISAATTSAEGSDQAGDRRGTEEVVDAIEKEACGDDTRGDQATGWDVLQYARSENVYLGGTRTPLAAVGGPIRNHHNFNKKNWW